MAKSQTKAKTTKPPVAAKAADAATTAITMTQDLRLIPLNQLELSPLNVRKGDIAAAMERAFAEQAAETEGFDAAVASKTARWLPEGMAFQGFGNASETFSAPDNAAATPAEVADVTTSSAEDAAPDALPAFLNETAA